jgi:hypothetical protein
MPEDAAVATRSKIAKTIEFEPEQYQDIEDFWHRTKKPNFSEALRVVVRHGLVHIRQQEAEGKLVA